MKIFFIRHAESEKNIGEKFDNVDDQYDKLTQKGDDEIVLLAKYLKKFISKKEPPVLITGNRRRTIESTQNIAKILSCDYFVESDLVPINPGSLSGLTYDESVENFPDLMKMRTLFVRNIISGYDLIFPNGDLFKDYELKMKTFVENCIKEYQSNKTIFIITHRSVILAVLNIYNKLLGFQSSDVYKYYSTPNGCIVEIELDLLTPTSLVFHGSIDEWSKNI